MGAVRTFHRVDKVKAVQFFAGNVEAEQAIRGWTGIPITDPINLQDGIWVVRRDQDGEIFLVLDEQLKEEFVEVIEASSE
jgi:hypothetical protein